MTLVKPTVHEVGAAIHARVIRMSFSAFLDGPGVAQQTDYTVTGDAATLRLNITAGTAFVQMPGALMGYEPCLSDSTESRTIATAPNSGTRHDLVYVGVKDIEAGSTVNDWDLYIDTNPTVGAVAPSRPADTNIKGWLILGTLDVPAKVTKGSQCIFHRVVTTTAPIRDGGFTGDDIVLPQAPQIYFHRMPLLSGGYVRAHNPAPFTARAVECVGVYPRAGIYRPTTFSPYRLSLFQPGYFEGWWFGPDGNALAMDPGIGYVEFYAIMWPGTAIHPPAGVNPYVS